MRLEMKMSLLTKNEILLSLVCVTRNTILFQQSARLPLAKIQVPAREKANPVGFIQCLATVLVTDCFGGGALVGLLSS